MYWLFPCCSCCCFSYCRYCSRKCTAVPWTVHASTQRSLPGRSTSTNRLLVQPIKLSTVGSRAFPVAGPKTWNALPEGVTFSQSEKEVFSPHHHLILIASCLLAYFETVSPFKVHDIIWNDIIMIWSDWLTRLLITPWQTHIYSWQNKNMVYKNEIK